MYEIYQMPNDQTIEELSNNLGIDLTLLKNINGIRDNKYLEASSYIIIPKRENDNFKTYIVQTGDTIIDIANKNNLDYLQLLELNGLDKEEYIYPGQEILIPNNILFWITKDNNTLEDIANKFNTTIEEVIKNNKNIYLKPEQLFILKKRT